MQDYIDLAKKNGVGLKEFGACQFCGAKTQRGIHECLEIFNIGFQGVTYAVKDNHIYRFLLVDAHTLQHSEIHGRWSNHFHLTRLHLIFHYNIKWDYQLSSKLSDCLNRYKRNKQTESLTPPKVGARGLLTTTDILKIQHDEIKCKILIEKWAKEVYHVWKKYHNLVDVIAHKFLN